MTCCAQVEPSPVVELNRAVAVAMRDGPAAGLALIDAILARGDLSDYRLAHAARADLCRRLGRTAEARASYQRARSPSPGRSRSGGFSSGGWPLVIFIPALKPFSLSAGLSLGACRDIEGRPGKCCNT